MIQLWIPISFVYCWPDFKIVEQWSQIMWQLRMGSIITPRVLKWLASTIRNYYCQWPPLAPDWTPESDRCEERAICANSILVRGRSQRRLIAKEQIRMCPYDGIRTGFLEIQWRCLFVAGILRIHGATRWTVWAHFRRPAESACIHGVEIQLICRILTWEWTLFASHTVPIGWDKVIIWLSDSPNWEWQVRDSPHELIRTHCGSRGGYTVSWRVIGVTLVPGQES